MSAPIRSAERKLSGWGNHPVQRCHVVWPTSIAALRSIVADGHQPSYVCRGLGRSYGDAALNRDGGVVLQRGLNRLLSFHCESGVLECEAGVSLAEIGETFLPRGWWLPTSPGTKYVTIGGAIAADVHGKDHHQVGSFGNFVLDLELLKASGDVVTCSPSQDADLFWATIGGMGLTGVILSARIQLRRVETAYCQVTYRRTANLDESLDYLETTQHDYRYSVAWIDCAWSGKRLGRSVIMLANDAAVADLPPRRRARPLVLRPKREMTVPFRFPGVVLNSLSVRAFNTLYYVRHADRTEPVDFDSYFYPLDALRHWNRVYGRRGFVQYQALFPLETARRGLVALLTELAESPAPAVLGVLKRTGPATRGMLSYLRPGYTLAVDIPNTGDGLRRLARRLDEILLKHGGRLYLAKDAMTTPDAVRNMYDRLGEFRTVKAGVDPNRRFLSSQARRLEIVEPS